MSGRSQGWPGPGAYSSADPHQLFREMNPIAEGRYGRVYSAYFTYPDDAASTPAQIVAVKRVSLEHTEKLEMLAVEMELMSTVIHQNILVMEDLCLDLAEDSIWIQMELMDRSVADVYDVLKVDENIVARFAFDVSLTILIFQHSMSSGRMVETGAFRDRNPPPVWNCSPRCSVGQHAARY
jgi:serine/threonine protein kinase